MSDPAGTVYQLGREDQCPHCGSRIDSHLCPLEESRPPREGDIGICGTCLGVLVFTAGTIAAPSLEELCEILSLPGAAEMIATFRAAARRARHEQ